MPIMMLKCLTSMRTSFLSNKVSANLIDVLSVNAIGCGKVGKMTHGVFYIVNNRRYGLLIHPVR